MQQERKKRRETMRYPSGWLEIVEVMIESMVHSSTVKTGDSRKLGSYMFLF